MNRPCGGNLVLGDRPLLDFQGHWMTSPAFWVLALLAAHIAQVDQVASWRSKEKVFTRMFFGEIESLIYRSALLRPFLKGSTSNIGCGIASTSLLPKNQPPLFY